MRSQAATSESGTQEIGPGGRLGVSGGLSVGTMFALGVDRVRSEVSGFCCLLDSEPLSINCKHDV